MTKEALNLISTSMEELGIEYAFMEYEPEGEEIIYPYFTGEYMETPPTSEDGLCEATFILNGFSRSSWEELETAKTIIENYFSTISGKTVITEDGNVVAVFYLNSTPIPTGDAELKRLQVILNIKEWKGRV